MKQRKAEALMSIVPEPQSAEDLCWLCGRPFGQRIQWHHTVPKSKRGRRTVPVHPICHRAIHKHFTNAELARFGEDCARLLQNAKLAGFVDWVQSKPPDFHAPTR